MTQIQRIPHQPDLQPVDGFDALTRVTLLGLESQASQRVYRQTFNAWAEWCVQNGSDPLDLRPGQVVAFLADGNTTKATRQRQLSALRKLAQMLYILDPSDDHRRIVEALKLTKAPTTVDAGEERSRKALTPSEADKMLRVWNGSRARDLRNRALVALLLLGGIRRSEAAALRWQDVDFENGVLYVRHGKGDKSRDVPLAGEYALDALRAWQMVQPAGYQCIFCSVNKGGNAGKDRPIIGTRRYRLQATRRPADVYNRGVGDRDTNRDIPGGHRSRQRRNDTTLHPSGGWAEGADRIALQIWSMEKLFFWCAIAVIGDNLGAAYFFHQNSLILLP